MSTHAAEHDRLDVVETDVARALLQIVDGDVASAAASCRRSASSSPLARHLADYLAGPATDGVYTSPEAFERFISGGSNVELYEATIESLATTNRNEEPSSMLDIGCGDGRVTEQTVPPSCRHLQLLEPSDALLRSAQERLRGCVPDIVATCSTVQELVANDTRLRWDATQSTFALHNLEPDERRATLAALAGRTRFLSLVEFDVPDFADRSPAHAAFAAAAYEVGVEEYADDQLVIDGFLLPVLIGQFATGRPRHTFEQSVAAWVRDLADAGFESVTAAHVCSFWWADAFIVTAAGRA